MLICHLLFCSFFVVVVVIVSILLLVDALSKSMKSPHNDDGRRRCINLCFYTHRDRAGSRKKIIAFVPKLVWIAMSYKQPYNSYASIDYNNPQKSDFISFVHRSASTLLIMLNIKLRSFIPFSTKSIRFNERQKCTFIASITRRTLQSA